MNDLDQLRDLRAEIPYPERSRLSPGRSRLLSAARQNPHPALPRLLRGDRSIRPASSRLRRGHRSAHPALPRLRRGHRSAHPALPRLLRSRRSIILLPVAAAAAAATLIGYAISPHGASAPGATSSSSAAGKAPSALAKPTAAAPAATSATLDARRVLDTAASAVAARAAAATEPAPGQWIYARTVDYQYGQRTTYDNEWITFDGTRTAYYQGGQLIVHQTTPPVAATAGSPLAAFWANITPKTAYDALASLPSNPQQLLTVVAKAATTIGAQNLAAGNPLAGAAPKTRAQLEFDYLTLLLWNAAGGVGAPPAAEAAAYHALALLPGVTVQEGVRDAAGVPAIAVSVNGGYNQLLLDRVSYQVLGLRLLSTGIGPVAAPMDPATLRRLPKPVRLKLEAAAARRRSAWPPKGTVQESLAYVHVAEVGAPGLR